jgi:iron complex outermembrane receptor protein
LPNLNLTIDGYRVNVNDRIIRTGNLFGPTVRSVLGANGYSGTEYVAYFTNAVDTRSTGLDLVADTSARLGTWGKLDLNAALNVNKTEITRIAAKPGAVGTLDSGFPFFGRDRQGELSVGNPLTKLILTARWRVDGLDVNLQGTRYGSLTYWRSELPSQDIRYGAKWITDLDVSYGVTRSARLTVGAANVFNVRPDANGPIDPNTGVASLVYGPSPFAPSGGFYYGRITFDF